MTNPKSISWMVDPNGFRGEIGATVALDARRWREAGAEFTEIDDGDGETVGIARGRATTTRSGSIDFGVLDYGEPETFLLVATELGEVPDRTAEVLDALREAGILGRERVLSEEHPSEAEKPRAESPMTIQSEEIPAGESDGRLKRRRKRPKRQMYGKKFPTIRTARVISFDQSSGFAVVRPYKSPRALAVHRRDITIPRGAVLKAGMTVKIKPGKLDKARLGRIGKVRL